MKALYPAAAVLLCAGAGVWFMLAPLDAAKETGRPVRAQPFQPGSAPPAAAPMATAQAKTPDAPVEAVTEASPAPVPAMAATAAPSRWQASAELMRRRYPGLQGRARLPVVFEIPPEEVSGLNPRQIAAAIAIAEQFHETMGGEGADVSTKEYLEKWRREQPLVDYQLRAAIGAQAYARWQEEAYLRAKAAGQASAAESPR